VNWGSLLLSLDERDTLSVLLVMLSSFLVVVLVLLVSLGLGLGLLSDHVLNLGLDHVLDLRISQSLGTFT